MKTLVQLRDALNAAFQDLSMKTTGRLIFYTLYVFLFSIITAIAVYFIMKVLTSFDDPGFGGYNLGGWRGAISLMSQSGTAGALIMIFLMPYYKSRVPQTTKKYSIGDMFNKLSISEWGFFVVGLTVTLGFSYFVPSDYRPFNGAPSGSLEGLMVYTGLNSGAIFDYWIDTLIAYLITYLPLVIISIYLIRLKKGSFSFNFLKSHWKNFVALLLSFIVLTGGFEAVMQVVSELVISLFAIPIQEEYTVLIITVIIFMLMTGMFYMALSKVMFYCFFAGEPIEEKKDFIAVEEEDLLDQ